MRRFWRGWQAFASRQPKFSAASTTRPNIISRPALRQTPRCHSNRNSGHQKSRVMQASIYGTVYLSIALLATDEKLDWTTRSRAGIEMVQGITQAKDHETKREAFFALGPALMKAHSGVDVEHHTALEPTEDSGLADELEVRLMTVPDPEIPGATIVLCQAAFLKEEDPEFYVATHSHRMEDAAYSLFPAFESFAKKQPSARGAMLVLHPNSDWYCLYFDGRRWINLLFLEWQSAASMGLQ